MAKAHAHYQAILNERGTQPFKPALKYLQEQMVLSLWTPSIGQRTNLSTRNGNCGQKSLDSPLMPWREIQRKPRFLTSIIGHIESCKNSKTFISQSAYDELENTEGKCSSESIESSFTLFELLLAPKSNPLLAVEELHFTKQGSMTSGEFHSHIVAKRCKFPNPEAEERAIRDTIFLGMNSQQARDKAINLMNEEAKELTVDFLMNQLAIEDCNAQHKILSQLNSSSSVNFAAYNCRQNKGRSKNHNAQVERMWDRIILEHKVLQITVNHLDNPQVWGDTITCGLHRGPSILTLYRNVGRLNCPGNSLNRVIFM